MRIRSSLRIRQGSCSSRSKLPRIHPVLLAGSGCHHSHIPAQSGWELQPDQPRLLLHLPGVGAACDGRLEKLVALSVPWLPFSQARGDMHVTGAAALRSRHSRAGGKQM